MAFELTKEGQGTSTTVSLTPVMFPDEDLDDNQRANLEKAPKEFDKTRFDGILYEMDDEEMIEKLVEVGFDVSKIGLEAPNKEETDEEDYDF